MSKQCDACSSARAQFQATLNGKSLELCAAHTNVYGLRMKSEGWVFTPHPDSDLKDAFIPEGLLSPSASELQPVSA